MTATEILKQLEPLGTESYRRVMRNHGVQEPLFGVKIEELKKFQKRIRKDYQLALDLFETRVYDAQYLAGLIADETRMTKKDLQRWLAIANCPAICTFSVAWVAAETSHGFDLALKWVDSKTENTAQTGWSILSSSVAISDDTALDLPALRKLLERVGTTIHQQPNLVRSAMNQFVISAGSYVVSLTEFAIRTGEKIGPVSVDMGETACKVPFAPDYIRKVQTRGTIGRKRKTARC